MKVLQPIIIPVFWISVIFCVIGLCLWFLVMINNYIQTLTAVSMPDEHDACASISAATPDCSQQE